MLFRSQEGKSNLVLLGIKPSYASTKYGYIIPEDTQPISVVKEFKEKPDIETAETYIKKGALWNAGVFGLKLGYILNIAKERWGESSYTALREKYSTLDKISFDYAVVEGEKKIQVITFDGEWKDIGTWNTITEIMSDDISGNAVAPLCNNTHIINELQIPLVALGTNNLAIVATPDGMLVTDKDSSEKVKDFVFDNRPMFEKRVWGEYRVLDYRLQKDGTNSLTKHLIIKPEKHISYQRHFHRAEIWTVVEGSGELIINGTITPVSRGDVVRIEPQMKHAIKAKTELHIIEVQMGDILTEEDIERLDWEWND